MAGTASERPSFVLKRYPNGIDSEFFFQKNASEHFPEWLRTEPVQRDIRQKRSTTLSRITLHRSCI